MRPMQTLDCKALKCPLPLLKLKVALAELEAGHVIELMTTDAVSCRDIPAFCKRAGHQIVLHDGDNPFRFHIRKSA
jgi:tRNA 2-thiouridine synthesizing protein A